jgi:oligopeptide transport system ATP-binding protein
MTMEKQEVILSARNVHVRFNLRGRTLHALRGIDLDVYKGEVLAIVGESGSGKSVFTKTFMGLLDANGRVSEGTIDYFGRDDGKPLRLSSLTAEKDWLAVRGHEIAMIMQDPMTSLNPLKTIGAQIEEAVTLHQGLRGRAARAKTIEYLRDVGIPEPERRYAQYPHEFSGGMRQRVVIAIAVACNPQILICDEPTTALDVTIQAQILALLKEMRVKYRLTIILITHDLGVVANIADRVAVMYAGDIVEIGTADEVYYDPRHPYTWALLSSMPQVGVKGEDLFNIHGTPPNLFAEIRGDAFAPRNPQALKIDFVEQPPYFEITPTHRAKTWLLDPRAPKVEPPAVVEKLRKGGL